MTRMGNLPETVAYFKAKDPDTYMNQWYLVKWLRRELSDEKKNRVREALCKILESSNGQN